MKNLNEKALLVCVAVAGMLALGTGMAHAQTETEVYSGIGDGLDQAAASGGSFAGTRIVPAFIVMALVVTAIAIGRKLWKRFGPQTA